MFNSPYAMNRQIFPWNKEGMKAIKPAIAMDEIVKKRLAETTASVKAQMTIESYLEYHRD